MLGGSDAKIFYRKIFLPPPPSDLKKFQGPPFWHAWKLRVNPIKKHVNSIFSGKFVVFFFKAPLQGSKTGVKNFKGPPFCIRPRNKCLWTVTKTTLCGKFENHNMNVLYGLIKHKLFAPPFFFSSSSFFLLFIFSIYLYGFETFWTFFY